MRCIRWRALVRTAHCLVTSAGVRGSVGSVQAWSVGRKELQLCAWDVGSDSAALTHRIDCAHAVRCIARVDDLVYLGGGTSISIVNLRGEVKTIRQPARPLSLKAKPMRLNRDCSCVQRVQPMLQFPSTIRALAPCPW